MKLGQVESIDVPPARIRAALLDDRGVFVRVDELESAEQLTQRHLPDVPECDLPPNEYIWIDGAFWPLEWAQRIGADHAAT